MPQATTTSPDTEPKGAPQIADFIIRSDGPDQSLAAAANAIAHSFGAEACAIFLLEPDRANLILAAGKGVIHESVGLVRLPLTEGLVGLVAQEIAPLAVEDAAHHPRYRFFPESGEGRYQSFLGAPIVDRGLLQGVVAIQTVEPRRFSPHEIETFKLMGPQLAPIVSEARKLKQFIVPTHERLWGLARNLNWSWDWETATLFRELDPVRWRELEHNPIALLSEMSVENLGQRAGQLVLHSRINWAHRRLAEYLGSESTWGARHAGVLFARPVAYFSAEFGLHESFPVYSGGLGILAGDHLKSASDLGVPLIGVGLFYKEGYFRQALDRSGWQKENYVNVDMTRLPVEPALDPAGDPIVVKIETRTGAIAAKVWQTAVGRCRLVLLDSDVEGNTEEDRNLTARLYGGDNRARIRQEVVLGIGGVRALEALGIRPGVFHLNEGHSAFAALETTRLYMLREGMDFDSAAHKVARRTVFTTHTPVAAGHDRFTPDLVEEHIGPLREQLGLAHEFLLSLGRVNGSDHSEAFCMTVLALKISQRANAVSALHGHVSRNMWKCLWGNRREEDVPIGHITNGIHVPSWLAPQMQQLFQRNLATGWRQRGGEPDTWSDVKKIDDGELWETHLTLKARLLDFVRHRAAQEAEQRGEGKETISQAKRALSPDALTIGFARRFATYKRANLLFSDIDRLAALVNDPQKPIQFVFAGKAHPQDEPGKTVLREIFALSRDPRFEGKIVFVENYDMNVGRHFVQGVDVWLNTPRRPLEASGTSGQKVVLNGGLNLSILDGWWAEAFDGRNGFGVGLGDTHSDVATHDARDGAALFHTLEQEVVPLYYQRDEAGLPHGWIGRMKRAIRTLGWRFSADRMVMDYVKNCYLPAGGGTSCDMNRG